MENASKALLIVGGILLVMLIIGILIFGFRNVTDYYNSKDELKEVDDVSKFNLQFSNYESRDVYGYELISLSNKVSDYNYRYADVKDSKNDKKYNKIKMTIDFGTGGNKKFQFRTQTSDSNILFKSDQYINEGIDSFIKESENIEEFYKGTDKATQLAKSIDALILSEQQFNADYEIRNMSRIQSERVALAKYQSIMKDGKFNDMDTKSGEDLKDYLNMCAELTGSNSNVMKYYEYYQFKKARFTCTSIGYDDITGRVVNISFKFENL